MIRVSNLTKRFGPTLAVDDLSFVVARGEVVGFLGPNGAGKTTTLRVLTGFHPATSGAAEVAGHDLDRDSLAARRQIGYLPENVPIYPDLRVIEYLRYRAALKGVPARARQQAVERAMGKAGITEVARKLCGHVSRGYRQRVGLADALVANPPILILDEPTSGLDPNQRRRVKQVIMDLAAEHTILFSSHILSEVQDVSSRVLVIHRGRLRADGVPSELVQRAGRLLRATVCCSLSRLREVTRGLFEEAAVRHQDEQDGRASIAVQLAAGVDPSAELGERLLRAGVAVRELQLVAPSLEQYLQMVTEGSDPPEDDSAAGNPRAGTGAGTGADARGTVAAGTSTGGSA